MAVVDTTIIFIVEGEGVGVEEGEEEEDEEGGFNVLVVTCGSSMVCQNDECNSNSNSSINIDEDNDRHSISNRIITTTVYKNSM